MPRLKVNLELVLEYGSIGTSADTRSVLVVVGWFLLPLGFVAIKSLFVSPRKWLVLPIEIFWMLQFGSGWEGKHDGNPMVHVSNEHERSRALSPSRAGQKVL